jgi:hypothetical protein
LHYNETLTIVGLKIAVSDCALGRRWLWSTTPTSGRHEGTWRRVRIDTLVLQNEQVQLLLGQTIIAAAFAGEGGWRTYKCN